MIIGSKPSKGNFQRWMKKNWQKNRNCFSAIFQSQKDFSKALVKGILQNRQKYKDAHSHMHLVVAMS